MVRRKGVNPENNPNNNVKQKQAEANKKMSNRKQELRDKADTKTNMTKEQRLKARKKAYKEWLISDGTATYLRLAEETGLTRDQLKYYKNKDKWDERFKKDKQEGKVRKHADKKAKEIDNQDINGEIDEIQNILDKNSLTDRERLFVMNYLKTFNTTQSAIAAGYAKASAHTKGTVIMGRKQVYNAITEVRKLVNKQLLIDAYDIINEYIRVAFADITNYVTFDGEEVKLKNSASVDGSLVSEVKQSREGVSLKLNDKMKALERLEKLFEIMPDRRLELEQKKYELQKDLSDKADNDNNKNVTIVNDIR